MWLYGLILNNYPVTYSFHGVFFELRYQNVTWNLIQNWRIESTDILFKLTRSYFKSISSPVWLYLLSSYLFVYRRLFGVTIWKCYMEFDQIGGLNQEIYLIQVIQEYFKAFSVALWLDFEQLSRYLFVYRQIELRYQMFMEFDTKLEDWINRYLIQTSGYLKSISYRIAFWLYGWTIIQLLFVYWAAISKCYMEFDTKLEDWKECLIQTYQKLLKSISSHIDKLLGWLYGLFLKNYSVLIRLLASFCIYGGKILLWISVEIEGLNQQTSYWNLAQVISSVFQVI